MEEVVELTRAEFDALLEYSCSLPTGVTIGKQWKRNGDAYGDRAVVSAVEEQVTGRLNNWWLGTYISDPDPQYVGIKWQRIQLKED